MMKRRLFVACCATALAASAAWGAEGPPLAKLSAAQIVEKNAAARGGLTAWRAVEAITMSGELDAGGKKETKLPFVLSLQRPHRSRLEIRFQDQTAVQVWDGTQGWKLRPYLNRNDVEPYTPAEAKSAASWDELDGPLIDHARKGTRVELAGTENVEGKPAYKLALTAKDGTKRNLWVDGQSFLEVKIDGEPRRLDGRMHKVAIYYRDYKSVSGLQVPHMLETVVAGVKSSHKMTIEKVALNPKIDAMAFAKPQVALAKAALAR
jgi:outer membrane lipoprotein-sorting protein